MVLFEINKGKNYYVLYKFKRNYLSQKKKIIHIIKRNNKTKN